MDLERSPPRETEAAASAVAACSICLDPVVGRGVVRSVAKLQCGHEFHLDCIGSAFNAKGAMQCPNCRKIENGCWLYASGQRPSPDIDTGSWVTSEAYDITSDLPFGFPWCPFSGFTQLASVFEEREAEPTSYEPRNQDSEHRYLSSLPVSGIPDRSVTPFGMGLLRYDSSGQHGSRPYAHHPPLIHRPVPRSGSNLAAPLGSVPTIMAEARGHGHSARGHMYQQSMQSVQSSPVPPTTRRVRPRALTITSFIAAASSAEIRPPQGFSAPAANNRSVPDAEGISRPVDQPYAWGHEVFAPIPWNPAEENSHWWAAFNAFQSHAFGNFSRRLASDRVPPNHPENGYHQSVPPQRMPPFL